MIKGAWQWLKEAIKASWNKLINALSILLTDIKEYVKGGMNQLLWAFEFEPVIRVNTKIKF